MRAKVVIDKDLKALARIEENRLIEVKFYDSLIGNIYRGKVINKIDSLKGYFVEYEKDKTLYMSSTIDYKIGDNVIVQYVRDPANGKLALGSINFKLENESYSVKRFPEKKKPRQKKGAKRNDALYKDLILEKERLIREEKFFPTPKTLYEDSYLKSYLGSLDNPEIIEGNLRNLDEFKEGLSLIKDKRPKYKEYSLIIDQLETLTVIDINSEAKKSKNKKDKFLENINLDLIDFIVYNLKLRNIGGMVVIDFLRNKNKEIIEESFRKKAQEMDLEAEIYGFTAMGLFELSIKRRGDSLYKELDRRNLLS